MRISIVFDCVDPARLAEFWAEALGYRRAETTEDGAGIIPEDKSNPAISFFRVPEAKAGKNRLHLDLVPERELEAELDRLRALGATVVSDRYSESGCDWFVLTDPEGNEFCICKPWS